VLQRDIGLKAEKPGCGHFEKFFQQHQAEAFGLIFFIYQQEQFGGILAWEFEVAAMAVIPASCTTSPSQRKQWHNPPCRITQLSSVGASLDGEA